MTEKSMAQKQWYKGAVIYQVYPRSFQDSNNDGIGDLRGIINRIDYIKSLGVDAIWISPFFKSPMKDFGYDISDYRDIDPLFGNLNDFDELIEQAHDRDIKIIIDQAVMAVERRCHGIMPIYTMQALVTLSHGCL